MLHPAPLIDALYALALGLVLGLVYDLLRPPRRAMRFCGLLLDGAFCALAAFGAFSLAMADEGGRFGLWAVAAGFSGFFLWLALVSPLFAPVAERSWTTVYNFIKKVLEFVGKSLKSANYMLAKLKKCYIIKFRKADEAQGEPQ